MFIMHLAAGVGEGVVHLVNLPLSSLLLLMSIVASAVLGSSATAGDCHSMDSH